MLQRIFFFALFPALVGCLSAGTYTPIQQYTVVSKPQVAEAPRTDIIIAVRDLAYPQHYKLGIVYRPDAFTVSQREFEEWAELPRDTVTRALKDAFAGTGFFADVGSAPDISVPTLLVTGELRRFDEVRGDQGSLAVCEVRIETRTVVTAVRTETYRSEVPLEGDSGADLAKAMSAAVTDIVERAANDLVSELTARANRDT